MNEAATPMTIPEKVIEHIGVSHAALEKAAADQQALEATREKVAAMIPKAVDAAVSGERIEDTPEQRQKLAEILADPVQALEIFCKVAVHRNAAEHTLGTPVDGQTKTAGASGNGNGQPGYDSLTNPNVGVRTTRVKQSDHRLFSRLGLNPPQQET